MRWCLLHTTHRVFLPKAWIGSPQVSLGMFRRHLQASPVTRLKARDHSAIDVATLGLFRPRFLGIRPRMKSASYVVLLTLLLVTGVKAGDTGTAEPTATPRVISLDTAEEGRELLEQSRSALEARRESGAIKDHQYRQEMNIYHEQINEYRDHVRALEEEAH